MRNILYRLLKTSDLKVFFSLTMVVHLTKVIRYPLAICEEQPDLE